MQTLITLLIGSLSILTAGAQIIDYTLTGIYPLSYSTHPGETFQLSFSEPQQSFVGGEEEIDFSGFNASYKVNGDVQWSDGVSSVSTLQEPLPSSTYYGVPGAITFIGASKGPESVNFFTNSYPKLFSSINYFPIPGIPNATLATFGPIPLNGYYLDNHQAVNLPFIFSAIEANSVPEPDTFVLLLCGLSLLMAVVAGSIRREKGRTA